MRIDDSHEISRLVFSENKKKKKIRMSSATNFAWRFKGSDQLLSVPNGLFLLFYIAPDKMVVSALYFSYFSTKYMLTVLIRSALARRF